MKHLQMSSPRILGVPQILKLMVRDQRIDRQHSIPIIARRAMNGPNLEGQRELGISSDTGSSRGSPTFITNCIIILASQGVGIILSVVLEVLYARLLGPTGRGLLSLSLMAISSATLVGGLGGEIPITLWTADRTQSRRGFMPAIVFWGVVGSLVAAALWVALFWRIHPAFLRGITPRLAILVAAAIPAYIFCSYFVAALVGAERFGQRANLLIGQKVLTLLGLLILVFGRWVSPVTVLFTNLLGTALVLAAGLVLLRASIPTRWNLIDLKARLTRSLSLGTRGQAGNAASFLNYRLDVFFVNNFLGPAQVGLYSVGVLVSEFLWQIPYAVAPALLPRTARTLHEDNAAFTCLVVRSVLALAVLSGIVLAIVCSWIIPLLFGRNFGASLSVVLWILPGTIAFAAGKVIAADLAGREKVGYNSVCAILALVLTISLDLLLIPRMGINGAALASSVAYLFNTVLLSVRLKNTLCVSWKNLLAPTPADFAAFWRGWQAVGKPRL
jgi:O-antigen/teichoic acid export membrane protein